MLDFNSEIGTSIIHAMGLDPSHLSNANIYSKVKEVVQFFERASNPRMEVLKLLSRKNGDPLDIAWTYVQLKKEKQALINKLNPQDFEPDIAEEIVSGHLTIESKRRVRDDIAKQQTMLAKQKEAAEKSQQEHKESSLLENAMPPAKIDFYQDTLNELDRFDHELEYYG